MKIRVICPKAYRAERAYICGVLFQEFFGLSYEILFEDKGTDVTRIELPKGEIYICDGLFSLSKELWLTRKSLPLLPLHTLEPIQYFPEYRGEDVLPIIYGKEEVRISSSNENRIVIGIDVFGSCFFMLTRYEEYVNKKRDKYDRFPYEESVAYQSGFLDRPIVNEYAELLWCALKKIQPDLKRRDKVFRVIPTHDIDKPFGMVYDSWQQKARHFIGDLLVRRDMYAAINRVRDVYKNFFEKEAVIHEKKETFAFIFELSRKYSLQDIFFFMNSKCSWMDGNYTVAEPAVQELMHDVLLAGHKIGLHPSFISYKDASEISYENEHLNRVLRDIGKATLWGGRQHYLRWSNPETWQAYEDAGVNFDSSLTYAGHIGFRCGTCYDYPVFNLITRQQLKLREKPLLIMDGTLSRDYMGLTREEALDVVVKMAARCRRYQGEFVILWHNTTLDNIDERGFYSKMLERICGDAI